MDFIRIATNESVMTIIQLNTFIVFMIWESRTLKDRIIINIIFFYLKNNFFTYLFNECACSTHNKHSALACYSVLLQQGMPIRHISKLWDINRLLLGNFWKDIFFHGKKYKPGCYFPYLFSWLSCRHDTWKHSSHLAPMKTIIITIKTKRIQSWTKHFEAGRKSLNSYWQLKW